MTQWTVDYYADVDSLNLDGYLASHAPDASVTFGNNPPAIGRAAIGEVVGGLFAALSLMRHEQRNLWLVDGGATAVFEATVTHRTRGGAEVRVPAVSLLERNDASLATSLRVHTDMAPLFARIEAEKAGQAQDGVRA